jgi:hypothetical protein
MKHLLTLLLSLSTLFTIHAQPEDTFFYNGAEKQVLKADNHAAFISFKKNAPRADLQKWMTQQKGMVAQTIAETLNGVRITLDNTLDFNTLRDRCKAQTDIVNISPVYSFDGYEYMVGTSLVFRATTKANGDELIKQFGEHFDNVETVQLGAIALIFADIKAWEDPLSISNEIYETGLVEYALPDFTHEARKAFIPNDNQAYNQWYLKQIEVDKAWDITKGSSSVVVAILDDNFDLTHPDLVGKYVKPYNAMGNDTLLTPPGGYFPSHGTPAAGLIGASTDNTIGMASVGFNTRVMPIQIGVTTSFNNTFFTASRWIANAAQWILKQNKINTVAISAGYGTGFLADERDAYESMTKGRGDKGIALFAAAGNSGTTAITAPAGYPFVTAVGGSTKGDSRLFESNYGEKLDIVAPAEDILTASDRPFDRSLYYRTIKGTSAASPIVAAVAALVAAVDTNLTARQIINTLLTTADKTTPVYLDKYTYVNEPQHPFGTWNPNMGYGRLNAHKAVLKAADRSTPKPNLVTRSATYTFTGNVINCRVAIVNKGTSATTATTLLNYYLSTDATITASDTLLGAATVPILAVGDSVVLNFSTNVCSPFRLVRTYYAGFIIDAPNRIIELNESDNDYVFPKNFFLTCFTEGVNLTRLSDSISMQGDSIASFKIRLTNNGNKASTPFKLNCYVNSDQRKFTLADTTISALAAGSIVDVTVNRFVCHTLSEGGLYYFSYNIDTQNDILETNENDNVFAFAKTYNLNCMYKPCRDSVIKACSGTISLTNNGIVSPDGICSWIIQPPNAKKVTLRFTNISPNYDFIGVADGRDGSAISLGDFAGFTGLNPVVVGNSGSLYITFQQRYPTLRTDGLSATFTCSNDTVPSYGINGYPRGAGTVAGSAVYKAGEKATLIATPYPGYRFTNWYVIEGNDVTFGPESDTFRFTANRDLNVAAGFEEITQSNCLTTLTACSGSIEDGSGETRDYRDDQNCSWLIRPTGAKSIIFKFNEFLTETCCDKVSIYDGQNTGGVLLGTFSGAGNIRDYFIANSGAMFVQFGTNGYNAYPGWSASYQCDTARSYLIKAEVSASLPSGAGTITGNRIYTEGSEVILVATPHPSYLFSNWTDKQTGQIVATTATLRFTAAQNRSLVANFTGTGVCRNPITFTECSGSFGDNSISDDMYPGFSCNYEIKPAANSPIMLWFSELNLSEFDKLTIYDGSNITNYDTARVLGEYSTYSQSKDTLIALSGAAVLRFWASTPSKKWRLNYQCTYKTKIQYVVNLEANPLIGGSFSGGGVYTEGDTATIIAKPSAGFKFDKKWGKLPPPATGITDTFATTDTVRFVVRQNVKLAGYFKQVPTCEGLKTIAANDTTFDDGSGRLPFTPNLNCGWLIKPRSNPRSIAIKLTDVHFGVFNAAGPAIINIYDGESASAPLLLTNNGERSEDSAVANSGKAFVTFTSIASNGSSSYYVGNGGWQLQYRSDTTKLYLISAVEPSEGSVLGFGTYASNTVVTLTAKPYYPNGFINWTDANTGEILSTETIWKFIPTKNLRVKANFSIGGICTNVNRFTDCNKTFEDGSGDNGYKSNLDCAWLIQPASATSNGVLLYFNFMSVNKTDTVSIYDGTSVNGRLLGRFNGDTIPPRVIAKSGSMYIRFKTGNQTVTKLGWDATYSCDTVRRYTVYLGINDTLKGRVSGAGRYTEGSEVVLIARTTSRLYRFRGFNYPSQAAIQQDTLRFKITGDVVVYANFTEMQCGGVARFVHPDYTIEDGSYSNNYDNELDCAWLIQPPLAKRIDLRFTSFFLQNCCDSVNIYDGINAKGRLLGRFNGSNLPPKDSLVAYSGAMFITFKTDGNGTDQGWSLKYKTFYDPIPPANDNCYRAASFPVGALTDGTTVNATLSSNPNLALPCEPSQNIKDVWYKFRSDTGAQRAFYIRVSFDMSESLLPLKYAFYKDNCANLERISGCKQLFPKPEIQRDTFYLLDANQDYFVRVWTDSSAPVNFKIGFRSLQNFDQAPIANATTVNSCKPFTTVNVTNSNSRNWISLIDTTSGIVAEINPNGNLLGLTSGGYFINSTGTIRRANGTTPYLDRNIGIKVTNQPTTDVGVRLYFTEQERAAYFAAAGANPLAVTHYAGALCVASAQSGSTDLLPAVINRTANGNYYVEFNTRRFSGFFIGPNNRLVFSSDVNAERDKLNIVAAYPIPVTTELAVIFTAQQRTENGKLFITDILGKVVLAKALTIETGQNGLQLDVSTLANGLYFLNISDGIRQASKKIVKQ